MKKTIVISLKILVKRILSLILFSVLTTTCFSLGIPQYMCRAITKELLVHQGKEERSLSSRMQKIFSLTTQNTVYAAMPMEHTEITRNDSEIIPSGHPVPTPNASEPMPPETNLSKNLSDNIEIKNHTQKSFNTKELLDAPLPYHASEHEYKVLLVHTHTTECYFPNDRSQNPNENMIRIGKEFKTVLEQNGIPTLHIETVHDVPYTTSYKKSLESVTKALSEHPSIEVVIDLHRDAIYGANGEKVRPVATINGEECAQVMLVCGTDEGGLPHPYWKQNLSFGAKIQARLQQSYPKLARPLDLRKERFNTHTTKNSVIFEIGGHGNSLEEAIRGAKYAAWAVADVLKGN